MCIKSEVVQKRTSRESCSAGQLVSCLFICLFVLMSNVFKLIKEESSCSGQLVALPSPVTCFIALLSHKNHIFSHQGRAPLWKVSDHPIPYIQTAHKCLICPELTHSITFDTLFPNTRWVEESVKLNQLGDLISWKIISWKIISWKIWSAKKLSA